MKSNNWCILVFRRDCFIRSMAREKSKFSQSRLAKATPWDLFTVFASFRSVVVSFSRDHSMGNHSRPREHQENTAQEERTSEAIQPAQDACVVLMLEAGVCAYAWCNTVRYCTKRLSRSLFPGRGNMSQKIISVGRDLSWRYPVYEFRSICFQKNLEESKIVRIFAGLIFCVPYRTERINSMWR